MVRYSHTAVGCMRSITRYKHNIQLGGFTAKNIDEIIFYFKAQCQRCPMLKMVMNLRMPAVRLLNHLRKGPDSFIPLSLSENPMSVVQMDELGPLHIGEAGKVTVKVWLMICIEVVMREVHLCVMRHQSTPSFIRTLEILRQSMVCTPPLSSIMPRLTALSIRDTAPPPSIESSILTT